VVVGWAGALIGAIAIDHGLYVPAGIGLSVLAGALIDRWWAPAVPWGAFVVMFTIAVARNPGCSDCDGSWPLQFLYGAMFFALPASIAIAIGVGVRRAARQVRRSSPPPARPAP
jgi:hypothetical protein